MPDSEGFAPGGVIAAPPILLRYGTASWGHVVSDPDGFNLFSLAYLPPVEPKGRSRGRPAGVQVIVNDERVRMLLGPAGSVAIHEVLEREARRLAERLAIETARLARHPLLTEEG
jgi:hypothetical protein